MTESVAWIWLGRSMDKRPFFQMCIRDRIKTNYDHPFAFDTDLMIAQINELLAGRPVDIPTYDYAEHTRSSKTYRQEPQDVFIVEGILAVSYTHLSVEG